MSYQHCNGAHDLTPVMKRYGGETGVEEVVRWCRNCGGCVIDMDVDGRTDPGRSMSMMFPRIAEAHVSGVAGTSDGCTAHAECFGQKCMYAAPSRPTGVLGTLNDQGEKP